MPVKFKLVKPHKGFYNFQLNQVSPKIISEKLDLILKSLLIFVNRRQWFKDEPFLSYYYCGAWSFDLSHVQ